MEGLALRKKSKKNRSKRAWLAVLAIGAFGLVSSAKTTRLTGKIVAFDVMQHTSKNAVGVQNHETVVLEAANPKEKYVKVMFSSFGTTQIEPKYFDGSQPFEVEVFRDHSCDEGDPKFVTQVSLEHIARTYLLTDSYKNQPPARIKTLKCYVAIYKKKK